MGTELSHVDGRIDMTKLIVAFPNFSNATKNCILQEISWNDYSRLVASVPGVPGIIGIIRSRVQRSLLCQDLAVGHAVW
jgi:hypothetical protein